MCCVAQLLVQTGTHLLTLVNDVGSVSQISNLEFLELESVTLELEEFPLYSLRNEGFFFFTKSILRLILFRSLLCSLRLVAEDSLAKVNGQDALLLYSLLLNML